VFSITVHTSVIYLSGCAKISKLLKATRKDITAAIECEVPEVGLDCWSKKGLSASFLAISASFFSPISHTPQHLLLNFYQVPHPMLVSCLAERLMISLKQWKIEADKMLVPDGSD
jgi:hypothetical protein